jgi:hypothetical protein
MAKSLISLKKFPDFRHFSSLACAMLKKGHHRRMGRRQGQLRRPTMFTTDRFAQVVTALAGALVLSTLSIGAAVRAAEPGQSWIASVPIGTASAGDRTGA